MPKIITVTANTAVDHVIEVENFTPGTHILANSSEVYAAGKGINVARAIESLTGSVAVLGFVGRQDEALFNGIRSDLLTVDYTLVEGRVRRNITLLDSGNGRESHIRTPGFSVTERDCNRLIKRISRHLHAGDLVILSGSLPGAGEPSLYPMIIELCRRKKARVFLDSSGAGLAVGLAARPNLIKPNLQEFEDLTGRKYVHVQDIVTAARKIVSKGVEWVLVSRGENGAVIVANNMALSAFVECLDDGKRLASVGCGDALLGGFSWAQLQGYDLRESMVIGVATATANLFGKEPGKFEKKRFQKIKNHVNISLL